MVIEMLKISYRIQLS